MKTKKEKAFNNWKYNAVHLTFPNKNAISTIWGYCSYSDNHDRPDLDASEDVGLPFHTFMESDTCEIMILKAPDKLVKKIHKKYDFGGDTVKGYVTITEWLEILNLLAK